MRNYSHFLATANFVDGLPTVKGQIYGSCACYALQIVLYVYPIRTYVRMCTCSVCVRTCTCIHSTCSVYTFCICIILCKCLTGIADHPIPTLKRSSSHRDQFTLCLWTQLRWTTFTCFWDLTSFSCCRTRPTYMRNRGRE